VTIFLYIPIITNSGFHFVQCVSFSPATVNLGIAGNAGFNFVAQHIALYLLSIVFVMGYGVGARANDRHGALQYVYKWGNSSRDVLRKNAPNGGNAFIILSGLFYVVAIVGDGHRAKLPHIY